MSFERRRVLIWGKTYPELSLHHQETVCTGGCTEDGRPIRLYPVPLRYLPQHQQYKLYDVIDVPLDRNARDSRPESHKVEGDKIVVVDHLTTERGWEDRRRFIYADAGWHYECVEDLKAAQRVKCSSLGFVKVGEVTSVKLEYKTDDEAKAHDQKLALLKSQGQLFGNEQRGLDFYPYRVRLAWRCGRLTGRNECRGHGAVVMDWGLAQLGRKEGGEKAQAKMAEISDLGRFDLHLFMGNFFQYPNQFGIVGLWYPLKREMQQLTLDIK